jgi:hypothetical protein
MFIREPFEKYFTAEARRRGEKGGEETREMRIHSGVTG